MGMAASQARFLGLTARKSNVEYAGQQINQARTALANESANLFNKMLELKVPTPPSKTDYSKTLYTFDNGDKTNEIISGLGAQSCTIRESTPTVTIKTESIGADNPAIITFDSTGAPSINNYPLTILEGDYDSTTQSNLNASTNQIEKILNANIQLVQEAPFVLVNANGDKINIHNLSEYNSAKAQGYSIDQDSKNNILYSYNKNGKILYIQSQYIYPGDNQPSNTSGQASITNVQIPQEFYDYSYTEYKDITYSVERWEQDSGGRYISMIGATEAGSTTSKNIDLTCSTVVDDIAYEDAMTQYQYEKALYDKEIADINAKTEALQQEDRSLEMKLKQLDTEQNALKTELDSVSKVIKDNVERVFKTFQA